MQAARSKFAVGSVFAGCAAVLVPIAGCGFFRMAPLGEESNFALKPNECRWVAVNNQARGASLWDNPNPEALKQQIAEGELIPYEVVQSSLPAELVIAQRGMYPDHFEVVPANNGFLPIEEYQALLNEISFGDAAIAGDSGGGGE